MNFIASILGAPLGYVMYGCYLLLKNYGGAIILFSLFTKIIFWPLSVSSQKNSIRLLQLQPQLDEINQRYTGERDMINEAQYELYKREKYSPFKGVVPLLIQLVLIFGMINVIYNPLTHLLHLPAEVIEQILAATRAISGSDGLGAVGQLLAVQAVHDPANAAFFTGIDISAVQGLDLNFLGLNLGLTPSFSPATLLLLFPLISGLSSLALCLVQNRLSPAQQQQNGFAKWGMTIFLVAFSALFPLTVPAGIGLYWICSNSFGILTALLLNILYNPKKLAGLENMPQPKRMSRAEKKGHKAQEKSLAIREKNDYERFFFEENKQLVFYSVSSGQYKYFQTVIEYLLEYSDIVIHYITSDPKDAVFEKNNLKIRPYYIGGKKIIPAMLKMDADMVVMTVPDLQKYHLKRSIVRDDIEYVYMFHAMSSVHMTLRQGAVDNYDTVFCVGPHNVAEIRRTEEVYGLKKKALVKAGYSAIDLLLQKYKNLPPKMDARPQILIAPSWQVGCLMDSCIDEILSQLCGKDFRIILRPHPEYIKRFPQKMEDIILRHQDKIGEDFCIEMDFSTIESIYQSDIVITDWSNITLEFSYCTKRPSLFIDTPMKVMNPEYERLNIPPVDITMRDIVGKHIGLGDLNQLQHVVLELLTNKKQYEHQITEFMDSHLFHPGRSGEAGGRYIIKRLS